MNTQLPEFCTLTDHDVQVHDFSVEFLCVSLTQFSQGDVPLQGDFSAEHMIFGGILSHSNAHRFSISHTWGVLIDRRYHESNILFCLSFN